MGRLRIVVVLAALTALACAGGPDPTLIPRSKSEGYSLVIDAGSQGSRLRVYRWTRRPGESLPEIRAAPWPREAREEEWSVEVAPGLSSYAGNGIAAAETLEPLVEFGLQQLGVQGSPAAFPSILVLATAGVRRLPQDQQDDIVEAVGRNLRRRGFQRARVRVLSGREEALYGWLGGNYILGRLADADGSETLGGLDLGGASTQIAFDAGASLAADVEEIDLGGAAYRVYVRSDLGFGQDVAEIGLADASCYPTGFTFADGEGRGDFDACLGLLVDEFRHCEGEPCPPTASQVPPLDGRFLAVANYFYTSLLFGLSTPLSLAELERAGARYCATDWTELHRRYPNMEDQYLARFCFSSAYIVALLTEGYGFPHDTRAITAVDRIGGEKIAWTLGALLVELTR